MAATSAWVWVLLAAAAGAASEEQVADAELDLLERIAAAAVAESAIDRYAAGDWAGLRKLLTPEAARDDPDAMLAQIDPIRDTLGAFSHALLAAPIVAVSSSCHERRYVLAHERHAAHLSLDLCGAGEEWRIGHIQIVPSIAAHASRLVMHVMSEKLGVEFFEPVCRDLGEVAVGDSFSCWASSHGGDTLDIKLERTESGLSVTRIDRAGKAPSPTREVLEPIAREVVELILAGRHAELRERSSLALQEATSAAHFAASLAAFSERPDLSPRIEWLGLDSKKAAPLVRMGFSRDGSDHEIHLRFVPDRGRWRLVRYDFPEKRSQQRFLRERALFEYLVRDLTSDPGATIACPAEPEPKTDAGVACDVVAHGRRIVIRKQGVPGKPGLVRANTSDIETILHSRIARLAPELGWSSTATRCQEQDRGLFACAITSPQGNRGLLVVNRGNGVRVLTMELLASKPPS